MEGRSRSVSTAGSKGTLGACVHGPKAMQLAQTQTAGDTWGWKSRLRVEGKPVVTVGRRKKRSPERKRDLEHFWFKRWSIHTPKTEISKSSSEYCKGSYITLVGDHTERVQTLICGDLPEEKEKKY